MDLTLSVFFNIDRTYITMVERTPMGLKLVYVNSTSTPVNIEHIAEESFQTASNEVQTILKEIQSPVSRVTCTIPAESVLVSLFPGRTGITNKELLQLVNLEIRQAYPQFELDNFSSTIIPLAPKKDKKQMIMAVILLKQDFEVYKKILSPLGMAVDNIEISQMNAHSAFIYNYPEHADKNIALVGIQNKFADISILTNKSPQYYSLASLSEINKFGGLIEKEFDKLTTEYIQSLDGIFFFGTGLTNEHIEIARDTLGKKVNLIGRLNAFRMMKASLSQREREYCSRVSHIFPPCIGGCFPAYHERFKLV